MKKLVVYDSQYGNTEKIAQVIAKSLSVKAVKVKVADVSDLSGIDLLVVGSPTYGGRATEEMQNFLKKISAGSLKNVKVAVFDTRFREKDLNFALKLLVRTIGYAAPKMAKLLEEKGGKLFLAPEGFIVKGKEGPIAEGEEERAKKWIKA